MVLIGLLLLVVSGPGKLPSMARDFGCFVSEADCYTDELEAGPGEVRESFRSTRQLTAASRSRTITAIRTRYWANSSCSRVSEVT
jgi:Sec-independent protein translocase protein TatA